MMSSDNHDDFAHLKIPLQNILSATNNFDEENLTCKYVFANEYKGQLLWSSELINITAKRFRKYLEDREQLFWTEISMLSSLKHKNLVSLVGFCDENDEKVIIIRRETKGMLYHHLSDPMLLTWVRRLEISVGIAHALSYIHYDESRDFSVIHRYIESGRVLLNDDWEPKLSDFECSMKIKASQRHHSFHTNTLRYQHGYVDPTYIETKSVNHKSDIYSFGIVLFELLCGRTSIIAVDNNKYLAPLAITHYREKTLYDIIDPDVWKQMDPHSFNIFAEIAYDCLNEERSQRPNIENIVTRLEKALSINNLFFSGYYLINKSIISSPNHDDLAHLKIPLEYILFATNNFADKNVVGRGRFDKRYKGQLWWYGELIKVTARRFSEGHKDIDELFWTEVSMLLSLKHKNVVSLVGFCDENDEKIVIIKHEVRGLDNYLSDPLLLTWVRRLKISVGIAHALSYIHYDEPRDFNVIHRSINSATVLLDDDWEPKLSNFECSMKIQVSQRYHSFDNETLQYTDGYGDPTYIETKTVNHKSDIYSFGIVLFELLCGRKAVIDDQDSKYLAPLAITHYREKKLYDVIDPYLWKQMDPQSFNIFAKTAYDCLNEEQSQRPNIEDIVTRLEQALSLQLERENAGSVSFISACVESHATKNIKRLDPKYKKTGGVTHKSVNYSFGGVLLEALSRTTAVLPNKELGEGLLSQPKKSFKIFSQTADRPYIDQVVKRYEKAPRLHSIYENPELPRNAVDRTSSNHLRHNSTMLQWKNLEHLKIELKDIELATKNFDDKYRIGSGGSGIVYKAQLEHFDSSNSSSIEGKNKCELPKKRSMVAIKRIHNRDKEQGFIAEIEILTSCKHENIISLLGFCDEDRDHPILVYELASKGSLDDYLDSDKMTNFTWVRRLKICLDIAHGMNYVHTNTDHGKQKLIHRDIKSANILLGDNWDTKISDFGLSLILPEDQDTDTLIVNEIAGTLVYLDPEYQACGRISTKSDIYSFGVVLLEILTGRLAYDSVYTKVNEKGIAPIARDHFEKGTVMEIVDHKIKEETTGHVFSLISKGPNDESLDIFTKIAFQCLAMTQVERPSMDVVINELKKALYCQIMSLSSNDFAHLYIPLEDILCATNNFADETRKDGFANEYKGQLLRSGEWINIAARRLNKEWDGGEQQFWMEISMLSSLKHKNLVTLVGFCDENGEKIIVNKHQTRGSLRDYLSDPMLTWVQRMEISVGLAHALSYIHYDESREFSLIHRDINSYSVLLNDNWEPKLCDFQLSMQIKSSQRHLSFNDTLCGTQGYTDPAYINTHSVSHKSDLYSFGIVLFELLCSRKSVSDHGDNKYLAPVATFHYKEKILDDIIDLGLRKQMDPQSLNVLAETAYACLNEEPSQRPNIDEIVTRLENALKLQLECQNTEHSIAAAEVEGTSSSHDKGSVNFVSTRVESHVRKKTMSSVDLSHLKLSMQDMSSTINGFTPENIIRESSSGRIIYKGRLLHSEQFDIIAKVLLSDSVKDESKTFWKEISMLSSLKHKNLVSLVGFYDEEGMKVIVYKREANESLSKHLSDPTLTWMQRLKICVGLAKALSYIHYDAGRDFSVIHCNIKSSKILLDDKWEPKLSGFELSLKNTVARRHRLLLTCDIVKDVYLDPKYKKTGGVTHKSDVYSFGVVLFEVLCGRSATVIDELGEGLLSQLAKPHLDDMIDPHLRKQMEPESLRIFSETAYYCMKEERADRPYINQVVKRLKKALGLQREHEKLELPRNAIDVAPSSHLKWKNLEHLKIALNDIELATENFADKYCIGEGGYGMVYKAQLKHFDSSNSSLIDGENKCGFPKKQSTVAIKRINSPKGEQGFNLEIETLTSCKHENIISLLGFCDEGPDHMILVYELASKGSLGDYMSNSDKMINLTWMQRLKICLDIAHGLNYIHTNTDQEKQKIIHRDIKSDNILLCDNWEAKIADFGLSKFHPTNQEASTLKTDTVAGTDMYLDPEYQKDGKLNKKSDIYSFGVVLFEILTGRLAYDRTFTDIDGNGIAPIARHHFKKGTLMEIVDHKIKEETDEHVFSLSKGPNEESLDIFSKIAFQCLAVTQVERPSIDVVINELKKALYCQENHKDTLKISLEYIKLATENFSQDSLIGTGDSGKVYRGVATHADSHGHNIIAVKRLDRKSGQGEAEFLTELEILLEYKHENVIGLLGYSDEEDEKIIVYQYASKGSLDRYLSDDSLTWVMRLKICMDIAIGLEFLHGTVSCPEMVIHRDISSSNILLFDDWKAKISDFGLSLVCPTNQDVVVENVTHTIGYRDPLYLKTGFLTKESDIFSLGAVLFDILCGKQSSEKLDDEYLYLPFLAKKHYHVGKLDQLVFEGIKEQILPQSYTTFTSIALQCLHHRRERRPTAGEVIIQLKKALEFQDDYEIWEPKLPKDYKEIIQMSKCPENYSIIKKEDLYNIFSEGILLQQDKVLLLLAGNGERNEMVSATMFSYMNSCPHDWKSLPESRFEAVVEILDISNMIIEIKTRAQFLSPNVVYGVYLVFKFCDSRNCSSKPMYVNLKYRKGHESLHAYFATRRDEQWMMIELHRFSNLNEDVVFEFLLESFSIYYWGDGAIFLEGIEFRAIDRVKYEENRKLKEVQQVLQSNFNVDQVQQLPTKFEEIFKKQGNYDELFWSGEVNGKKLLVLSPKAALYKFSNVDLFTSIPSAKSRFQDVIELLPQQAFFLKCTIRSQMLSPDTEYVCYLVFKLSETCQGLHYPVKVRDVLHQENNEAEFVYFITPSPLNTHVFTRVPKQREDGWMEIQVWKFNSAHEFKEDSLSMNMKFTSLEGIMCGLIVSGLEFRPL